MTRYSLIEEKMPREFLLLQGTGCRWRRCTFCDYHTDTAPYPYEVNRPVERFAPATVTDIARYFSGDCLLIKDDPHIEILVDNTDLGVG